MTRDWKSGKPVYADKTFLLNSTLYAILMPTPYFNINGTHCKGCYSDKIYLLYLNDRQSVLTDPRDERIYTHDS